MPSPLQCNIYLERPEGFSSSLEASGCVVECNDTILLIGRHERAPQGNTWGIPGGKVEEEETPFDAARRELHEETGIEISPHCLEFVATLYCRHPDRDFLFHLFRTRFAEEQEVLLRPEEHVDFRWATFAEAARLPLIAGGREMLDVYRQLARPSP